MKSKSTKKLYIDSKLTQHLDISSGMECNYDMKEKFGQTVRRLFLKTDLTQRQFAEKAGISHSTLWRLFLMDSASECNITTLQALATVFGCTTQELKNASLPTKQIMPLNDDELALSDLTWVPAASRRLRMLSPENRLIALGILMGRQGGAYELAPEDLTSPVTEELAALEKRQRRQPPPPRGKVGGQ